MAPEDQVGPAPLARLAHVGVTHPDALEPAPRDVTFDVRAGEVVLLVGPSGCGKSTLAMAACGLIPHAHDAELEGRIVVAGLDTADSPPSELSRHVAMVFQDPDAQIVTGRVLDEVAFALENLLLPADEVLARAEEALRTVGLWSRREDDPAVLSGGGRQRLAVACALAMRPDLLVLDEPTANLDPAGTDDVYRAIGALVGEDDARAVLLVEHDLSVALPLATRVVVLDHAGRLVLDGAPDDVFGAQADVVRALGVGPDEAEREARPAPPPVSSPAAIRARSLTVERGRGRARRALLRDVSLEIPRGSFTAIIGPNGAGKTTLAQALAGVVPPPRGSVEIAGERGEIDPTTAHPRELAASVGFVFQNPEHQFVAHTVRDELAHGLRALPQDEREARVDEMIRRFGLTAHADRHPFRLSGGQKRRLSVGTALIGGADRPGGILVLDEPTFGQDRARAEELLSLLDGLNRRGTTIVVVTHDPELVRRHATHVAAVAGGTLRAFGPTAEVLPVTAERGFWEEGSAPEGPAAGDATKRPASPRRPAPLERVDSLALLLAVLPAMIGLIFTRDV
ncbi:MAG: ABC transporter ATP-binding protein, partial [Microbacterium sp.]